MKITVLGTGTFFVSKERSGPAYLLEVDNKKILIDCGPGTLMRLSQLGVSVDEINYVFLTHFHPDHSSDLFAFQMNFRLKDFFSDESNKELPIIYGPEGIEDFTKKLSNIYELPAFENYSKISYLAYTSQINIDGLNIRTFKVKHNAFGLQAKAYALRFEFKGKVFTFSGDAIKDENIVESCKDADVFICDASYVKGKATPAHMDTWEIGEISESSKVKKVVLTHFYPRTENIDLINEVKEKYSGEVIRAEDFMEIEV